MTRCDLHAHTWYSDGKFSPAEVIDAAAQSDIRTLAITDHDNCDGSREAVSLARAAGIDLIPAIEFTTSWPQAPLPRGDADVDLLGYFVDLDDPEFHAYEQATLTDIHERIKASCDALTENGYPITFEEAFAENHQRYAGAMQVIFALQRKKLAPNWEAGIQIFTKAWHTVRTSPFTIQSTIEKIHQAGGAAVLAHPAIVRPEGKQITARWLRDLVDAGLDGIEVYHWRLDDDARTHFLRLALEFDLAVTGGSDMHGWNRGLSDLGRQPVTVEMIERLRERANHKPHTQ